MILFGKDLGREVAIVAEVGVNHEGSLEAALRLLRLASDAGADAVKLQTYTPARFASASDPARLARVTAFALDAVAHHRLAREAERLGIALVSTPVTEDVVELVNGFSPAIKIASGDLTFEPVIRAAAATGKPVILSTGLGIVGEIEQALAWIGDEAGDDDLAERVVLLHCVSAYPTPIEEANLLSIPFLAERFGLPVGYSNHVIGTEACLAAIALGACLVEVHFTDRKSGREFRDHALSCDPRDLAMLVEQAPRIRAARGAYGKGRQPCELPNLHAMRKGVVAARDIAAGRVLTQEDLAFARPAGEFAAAERDQLLGRRLTAAVKAGELIRRDTVGP